VEKADPFLLGYDGDKECEPDVDLYAGGSEESSWKGLEGGACLASKDTEDDCLGGDN
jgi:hypothetical protein